METLRPHGALVQCRPAGRPARRKNAAGTGLLGASCPATHLCLLAGFTGGQALVRAWNGSTWSNLNALQTTGTWPYDYLTHVSCTSATSCEVVGGRYNNNIRREHTLAEVWNGSTWAVQATANP
jgi:hypothetical protein